ncbi:16S rRNA (uracil(1498)-N(3))-methyltransferase [Desulfonatronum sp. SC1]|uniref:16S rRNA (uracil(1498)-N(3))-methyltransferase n=1 Tax=Desulfonatronum sp. SC1 TaxID=2109626 RepID=UPI000D2FEEE4|nr:16S rRNA (uracil(1498)-N(3))-methyltransferase [Desulfonatronum sp. SC1]PTN38727.1 16S rRNA (uracil(1498)-N(3))-methyltransferase [Desulfonatronum sp. SC1]
MKSLYLAPDQWREPFQLEGSEAHHLLTVLRTRPGTTVRLFDGQGRTGTFLVRTADRKTAGLELLDQQKFPRPRREIHLALGWNKASRRGLILEKAVELRAAGLIFWQASRSQGKVPDQPKESWTDLLVNAAKQCDNPWLPTITTIPGGPEEVIRLCSSLSNHASPQTTPEAGKFLIWENASLSGLFDPGQLPGSDPTVLVLGPEGGLTEGEAQAFMDNGYLPRSLGRSTLRWETAALLCLGLCYWRIQGEASEAPENPDV